MREIKFRAWVKNEKKMVNVKSIHLNTNNINYSRKKESENDLDFGNKSCKKGNYELMQYTGLHDKNGKEVYEGDIVRCADYIDIDKKIRVIEWDNLDARYMAYNEKEDTCCGFSAGFEGADVEIIGNIYETPKLLEEEE